MAFLCWVGLSWFGVLYVVLGGGIFWVFFFLLLLCCCFGFLELPRTQL